MGEIGVTIARWLLKFSFFMSLVIAFFVLVGAVTTYLVVGYNTSVLTDIFGLIQVWLPFNLNVLLIWLSVAATGYLFYRLAYMIYNIVDGFVGGK